MKNFTTDRGLAGVRKISITTLALTAMLCGGPVCAQSEEGARLLATGGATQIEGSAGGGIVPWAVLSGYGVSGQTGGSAFYTHVNTADYTLNAVGAALTVNNRIELSFAHQEFDLGTLGIPNAASEVLRQQIFGAKVRLAGDLIYTSYPQLSAGVQYKRQNDFAIPEVVGARDDEGFDLYVSASKLFLAGLAGRNILLNGTVRATRANQIGLLGFGGDKNDGYEPMFEASAGLLLDPRTIIGVEYRQKPDNLSFAREEDWYDLFLGYFPNKHIAIVAAYARLGAIAGIDNQNGLYLNVQASF